MKMMIMIVLMTNLMIILRNKIWLKEITIYEITKKMNFNTETEKKYYHDIYNRKYYEIVKATQYGKHLIDIKVRECEIEFLRIDVRPKDNFKNKETIEEYVSQLVPFGKIKKMPNCDLLEKDDLKDKYVIKKLN